MKKVEQINSFSYFTIKTYCDETYYCWELSALVDMYVNDIGKVEYVYTMPWITYKIDGDSEDVFSADSEDWIINKFLPFLREKQLDSKYEFNNPDYPEENDEVNLLKFDDPSIKDVIELIELGIKIGMLKHESAQ